MRKTLVICAMLFLCSCTANKQKSEMMYTDASPLAVNEVAPKYSSDYERLVNNVIVKDRTSTSIVYQYKDVRIDEVVLLADRYCSEQGWGQAVLVEATLYKSFSRQATFSCTTLQ